MPDEETATSSPQPPPELRPAETKDFSETRKGIQVMPSVSIEPTEAPPMALLPDVETPSDSGADVGQGADVAPQSSAGAEGDTAPSE